MDDLGNELGIDAALIAERQRLDGARAVEFLEALPALVAHWQRELGLEGARIMPGGVLSGVFACRRRADGLPVVLKLAAPHAASAAAEAAALAAWGGDGACALLYASADASALLLERVLPGDPVRPGGDAEDVARAAALLTRLHVNAERAAGLPDASVELQWRFERSHTMLEGSSHARGVISHQQVDDALTRALELNHQAEKRVLLHGDFINKNLLIGAAGEWRAIDPRACTGDPCMDAAFWALAQRPGIGVQPRCEALAAAAGLDSGRVWAWARLFAVSEAVLVRDADRSQAHASLVTR